MNQQPIKGSCLCGYVRFSFCLPHVRFHYCHCVSCRKTTGSAFAASIIIPTTQFHWEDGESLVSQYTDLAVNPGFRRWFCSHCGGSVPRLNRTDEFMVVPAGSLDSELMIRPGRSIYWCERADWLMAVDAMPKYVDGIDSVMSEETLHPDGSATPIGHMAMPPIAKSTEANTAQMQRPNV